MKISKEVQAYIALWQPIPAQARPPWYVWTGDWYAMNGDKAFYCEWPLIGDSVVFDVGGYEGAWAQRIAQKYNPHLYVFEPSPRAYNLAVEKLCLWEKAKVFNFGLGPGNGTFPLGDCNTDGASFLKPGASPVINAEIVCLGDFLNTHGIKQIDLMAINIEGGEFELLPYMIHHGMTRFISRFMIQWHSVVDNAREAQLAIQYKLAETHVMSWNLGAWEAWERK